MLPANVSYRLIRKIKDEKFEEENLHQYSLFMQLGVRDFQIGVSDEANRMLFFEDYVFSDIGSSDDQHQLLRDLFDNHPLLPAGFWKNVTFSVKNNKFSQIPSTLFVEGSAAEYLSFNALIDPAKDHVLFCQHARMEAITVYTVPQQILTWLKEVYKNTSLKFIHQSTALIEGVLEESAKHPESPLYLYVDRFKLHILSAKGGRLIYYNQFPIKHFADYIKYIMLVMTALGMDQKTSRIVLWGYIGKNSPHYHEFVKYVRNVLFGERPRHLSFGYLFDEVQDHHFFDLYSIHLLT